MVPCSAFAPLDGRCAVTLLDELTPSVDGKAPTAAARGSRRLHAGDVRCALVGVGMAFIVGLDGTPLWRTVRLLVVAGVCIAVAVASRVLSGRMTAVAWVALGAIAAPIGATIGYSYLTTTGLTARAAGGVLIFGGGLAAVVAGIAVLVRAAHGWRRLLAVPITLIVAYVTVLPLSAAVYATNVPRPRLGSATPADRGLQYHDATLMTNDGVTLSGWYIPSTNRAAVVLLHGASSTRSNVLNHAAVLAHHGYGVLLFDARGHGRSGGRAMDFGWYGDKDVAAAVGYLRGRPDVDRERIGAVGMSMGGEEVIGAMAGDPRIKVAVAEGATNRAFADKAWLSDEYGLRGRVQQGVDWLTYTLADALTAASPPISLHDAVIAAAPRPVLLIAAGRVADEQLADKAIQAASPSTVDLWVVPGAGHTGGLRTQPQEWERRVVRFLDGALGTNADDV